jgi:DNA-binding CsgD family transcriptional regulator
MDYTDRNARMARMFGAKKTAKQVAKKMRMSVSNVNRIKKTLGMVKARKITAKTRKLRNLKSPRHSASR